MDESNRELLSRLFPGKEKGKNELSRHDIEHGASLDYFLRASFCAYFISGKWSK